MMKKLNLPGFLFFCVFFTALFWTLPTVYAADTQNLHHGLHTDSRADTPTEDTASNTQSIHNHTAFMFPEELEDALPKGAKEYMPDFDSTISDTDQSFREGIFSLAERALKEVGQIFHQRLRGAAGVLLVVIVCAAFEGFSQVGSEKGTAFLPMVGALSISAVTAGSLDSLIGLGAETIRGLSDFSHVLLPVLAAAAAASGGLHSASIQQITAVFLADVLLRLIQDLLMPLLYIYIGVLTAGACLPEQRLNAIADALKKIITWLLSTTLFFFMMYLTVTRVVTGAVDGISVRITKSAISGMVPVVGGIIAEASETVLAGAGILKNSIGIFGMLAVLSACVYPFLQLGIQYLLYKLTAFLAAVSGAPGLCRLIDGLGGAFGLILGMTGSCAMLVLISILCALSAAMP